MMASLNDIIALCEIDGKQYLIDITNDWSGINLLPTRCLNGKGLVIKEGDVAWVDLLNKKSYRTYENYTVELADNGTIHRTKKSILIDYAAYFARNDVSSYEDLDGYLEAYESDHVGYEINDYNIENIDSLNKPIQIESDITIKDELSVINDLILFKPLFSEGFKTNPLKLEERLYPVEYSYPNNTTSIINIKIPEGYAIESVPENMTIKYNDGACTFVYKIEITDGAIKLLKQYKLFQNIFPYTEYQNLKDFYEMIVKKHNESIVFKKI